MVYYHLKKLYQLSKLLINFEKFWLFGGAYTMSIIVCKKNYTCCKKNYCVFV